MKIFTIIIITLLLAGVLVRIIKVLRSKDTSEQTVAKQQLGQIAITLLFGFSIYTLMLMYGSENLRPIAILVGIPLMGLQGGRFMYKFMKLRQLRKQ